MVSITIVSLSLSFFPCDIFAGKPKKNTDELWIPYKRSAVNTVKTKSKRIQGIEVNDFYPDLDVDFSDAAEMESREREGEMILSAVS